MAGTATETTAQTAARAAITADRTAEKTPNQPDITVNITTKHIRKKAPAATIAKSTKRFTQTENGTAYQGVLHPDAICPHIAKPIRNDETCFPPFLFLFS